MLFIAPPMCLLSATALQRLGESKPRFARGFATTMIACGVCSIAVASLCFQGPLGVKPGQGAFAWAHGEVMTNADAKCLQALGEGVVMTPTSLPLFGDIVTLRGNRALYGQGAWDLADQSAVEISGAVRQLFRSGNVARSPPGHRHRMVYRIRLLPRHKTGVKGNPE